MKVKIFQQIERIQVGLFILMAFLMPVDRALIPPCIILSVLFALLYFCMRPSSSKWDSSLFFKLLPFLFLFGLYLLGVSYSNDKGAAWFDIETKLSLLAFPAIMYFMLAHNTRNFCSKNCIRAVLSAFLLGCLFLLGRALYEIYQTPDFTFNIKTIFEWGYTTFNAKTGYHTSYVALYFTFSAAICLFSISDTVFWYGKGKKHIVFACMSLLLTLVFIFGIFATGAKSGLLSLICLFIIYFIYELGVKKRYLRSFLTIGISVLFIFLLIRFNPMVLNKTLSSIAELKQMHREKNEMMMGSTPFRIYFWKTSILTIKEKPLFGYGTGDVKTSLSAHYSDTLKTSLYRAAYGVEKNETSMKNISIFNPHNQFFQTAIAIGIFGLLVLLSIFGLAIYWAWQGKCILFATITLLVFVNCLVESMLEVQSGIVFFFFFYFLFFIYLYPKLVANKIKNKSKVLHVL